MVVSPRTKRQVRADFVTTSFRAVGEAQVGRLGFNGLLNDDNSLVEVYNVRMSRTHQPTKLVDSYDALSLVKKEIIAVCITRIEDIGPHTLGRPGYSISDYPVWLTTGAYEILGTLQWSGPFDFSAIMGESVGTFVPLYDTILTHTLIPGIRIESPVSILNRHFIASLAMIKERQKRE
jgi:hypothetical protein